MLAATHPHIFFWGGGGGVVLSGGVGVVLEKDKML